MSSSVFCRSALFVVVTSRMNASLSQVFDARWRQRGWVGGCVRDLCFILTHRPGSKACLLHKCFFYFVIKEILMRKPAIYPEQTLHTTQHDTAHNTTQPTQPTLSHRNTTHTDTTHEPNTIIICKPQQNKHGQKEPPAHHNSPKIQHILPTSPLHSPLQPSPAHSNPAQQNKVLPSWMSMNQSPY